MVAANAKYARLTREQMVKLQELEQETGKILIAYEPAPSLAQLSEEQLKRLQQVEQELGVVLVGYRK